MADYYGRKGTGVIDGTVPAKKADNRFIGGKTRRICEIFDMASQPAASFLVIGRRPQNSAFAGIRLTTDTSLGTAQVSVGTKGSVARDKAAGTFTATDTPTLFGKAASIAADPVAADELVGLTTSAAALPSSGILIAEYFYVIAN